MQNEKGEMTFKERPKKELEMIEDVVRKSAGFNPQRGDQVVVSCLPFQHEETGEMVSPSWSDHLLPLLPLLKYLLVVGGPRGLLHHNQTHDQVRGCPGSGSGRTGPGSAVNVTLGPEGQAGEQGPYRQEIYLGSCSLPSSSPKRSSRRSWPRRMPRNLQNF